MKNKKTFSLRDSNMHIVEKKKIWFAIPLVIILIALIEFFAFAGVNEWDFSSGLNIGIDFTGGSSISVVFGSDYTEAKIQEVVKEVNKHGVEVSYSQRIGSLNTDGNWEDTTSVVVKYKNLHKNNEQNNALNNEIKDALVAKFGKEVAISSVGSTASGELLSTAFLSIFVAAICIFIYIIFRFELWSGLSAVIALFHDLIIMFALTLIFRIEINAPFVAALITILAYSINDTIVIFDRVRELIKDKGDSKFSYTDVCNDAIKSTITRSLYTSITTLLTIAIVAIFVPQIRNFALPIVFGIMAGTFSSIFIAAPLFVSIKDSLANSKRAKAEKAMALAQGREYIPENDYVKKQKVWNKIKSKFGATPKASQIEHVESKNVESKDVETVVPVENKKEKKKPQQTGPVNYKRNKNRK